VAPSGATGNGVMHGPVGEGQADKEGKKYLVNEIGGGRFGI